LYVNKLQRFAENLILKNVIQPGNLALMENDFELKGNWNTKHFEKAQPIVLELGCGKGEYSVGLSQKYPQKNFIGIDIKGARMWVGAKQAEALNLNNVAFLRTRIDFIEQAFAKDEVDEIWITFPDPQPQKTRERKRLTHLRFLERYRNLLKKGGIVHLKTDSRLLYDFTLEVIKENKLELIVHTPDLYKEDFSKNQFFSDAASIKTHYEGIFTAKGFSINYIVFKIH